MLAPGVEISEIKHAGPALAVAAILEAPAPPTCACGCGATVSIARKTDARTGAVAGQPLRFLKGHAYRLHHKRLEFAGITPAWFDAHVTIDIVKGCWLVDTIQVTIEGQRVYVAHIALLLSQGLPVTAEALDRLKVHRCPRNLHCVRPDHILVLGESQDEDDLRDYMKGSASQNAALRAAAIEAARARMLAARAERTSTNQETTKIMPSVPSFTPVIPADRSGEAA